MKFITIATTLLAAVYAQSSVGVNAPIAVGPSVSVQPSGGAMVAATNGTNGTTTTVFATRTVLVAGVQEVITVSVVVVFNGRPNTVVAVPTVVNGQPVVVAIPFANGTPVQNAAVVGSMTLGMAAPTGNVTGNGTSSGNNNGTQQASVATNPNGLPVITNMPVVGSQATKVVTGSLALLAAILAFI